MLKKFAGKAVDPLEGKEGELEMVEALGHGNFGSVFVVIRRSDGVKYALKQMELVDDRIQKLFMDEAGSMRRLSHQNVVRLEDFWLRTAGGLRGYLLLELCDTDLGKMIKEVRTMSVVNKENKNPFLEKNDSGKVIFVDYFIQGLTALDFMRLNGVIHSDIKPENIFIRSENDEEVLKIGDFGMAKIGFGSQLKATSLAGYSPAYQPPEARSDPNFKPGPISDIYSFGVSMWEIATLDSPDPAFRIELREGYASPDVVRAINAMLSGNPADRPSAESLLRRFQVCFRHTKYLFTLQPPLFRLP
jgi:serine/threonine protein kinase